MTYSIGIDIGGTFTDLVCVSDSGEVFRSKAFSTPDDYSRGIFDAIRVLVSEHQLGTMEEILSKTSFFMNGTTIVTNVIAEMKGSRVGLITTRGFGDTLRIARSPRTNDFDLQTQLPTPQIVERINIREVSERIDFAGEVVVPIKDADIVDALRFLVDEQHIEALAVCLLWSFKNPTHELRIKQIASELYPSLPLSLSSEIYPVAREYERMVTTVLNAFCGRAVSQYVKSLNLRLSEFGFQGRLMFMQSVGGGMSPEEAVSRPIFLMNSGPVGGVMAATYVGERIGRSNIITADMGGTSFDTSIIVGGKYQVVNRVTLNRLTTGLSAVEINAIGAGGGSICWIDGRGAPRVGPESAGSYPGPVCYGHGGTRPTMTDVWVTMNLIEPNSFLGGRVKLNSESAREVINSVLARPLGLSIEDTAKGFYQIAIDTMANAVRSVSIERGYDPREFSMLAYGGASGLVVAEIAKLLKIREVIIPPTAAVFSAYGLLWSDEVYTHVKTINLSLNSGDIYELNSFFEQLRSSALEQMNCRNYEELIVRTAGDLKFSGQSFELTIPVPERWTAQAMREVQTNFVETYERLYGEGTAWEGAEVVLLNGRVTVIGVTKKPRLIESEVMPGISRPCSERRVLLPGESSYRHVQIYRDKGLTPGSKIIGPCIVEASDTTILVPEKSRMEIDRYGNRVITIDN
ncbi:MAG: hydantoinase/oxoprolinase family protein [Alicyclobacillus sp.]|nr:hydantoinase/oxoprolinase family protein [Alicyclobacillus sp.]